MRSGVDKERIVYLNEFNVRMGRATYLPFVSGILRAYAEADPVLKSAYRFKPFIFYMDTPDAILERYDEPPDVAAFSVAMWNEQLSLHVAQEVKRRWPSCLIVFGGAHVPHHAEEYLATYPFIDIAVRAEGEEAFAGLLRRYVQSSDFAGVPNVTYRDPAGGGARRNAQGPDFDRDLDLYPSPYLSGLFDYMFDAYPDIEFQAIIETNRGCPFLCTFCYWGKGGTTRKYRYHSLERVYADIEWCGRRKIRYLFNADSNFGMHRRDADIARHLADIKQTHGFPEKFRTCWGKNTDQNIFDIAAFFHQHGLDKGITLARQSSSPEVLKNIKRDNIKMESYNGLQERFNDLGVPVYTEMILGLPGETFDSWRDGIEEMLRSGLKNQLFIYQCEVYPNTDLGSPAYQEKFGVKTRRIELREIHGSIRNPLWVKEYQEIVVETAAMSNDDWRRMTRLAVMTMLLHSMKIAFFLLTYLTDRYGVSYVGFVESLTERKVPADAARLLSREVDAYDAYVDALMAGSGRGLELPEYGPIYWDVEEASFLRLTENLDLLEGELFDVARRYLADCGVTCDEEELREAVRYQIARLPAAAPPDRQERRFTRNFPEYFERRYGTEPVPLRAAAQTMTCRPKDFAGDRVRFARETVLWGRKSGAMLTDCAWREEDAPTVMPAGAPVVISAAATPP